MTILPLDARRRELDARAREDARIIVRCQERDLAAFADLVRRHMADALRLAGAYLRNPDEAIDASQDAFVSAFEALPRFDPAQPFFPWLRVIVLTGQELRAESPVLVRTFCTYSRFGS